LLVAIASLAVAAALSPRTHKRAATLPPNIVLILTDDQTTDTLPANPPAMPWLQRQVFHRPASHWQWFPNAVFNTPLCCPSRATILTGRYAHDTGVIDNHSGDRLDESNTLATWLADDGYTTALVGKYLNNYPWTRGPYVPAGWDRFVGKRNTDKGTTYDDYQLIDQGVPLNVGDVPGGYATDHLADSALGFLRTAPTDAPYFLMYTPPAPHPPWRPAPRYDGAFHGLELRPPSARMLNDVRGKPAWVRRLPRIDDVRLQHLERDRRKERETLLSVDDAVRRLYDEVASRGELDRTVFIFLTDNGYAFGQHRWEGKRCPYEACIRSPLAIYAPWLPSGTARNLISNVDIAPTIADLAGVSPGLAEDGRSFAGVLHEPRALGGPSAPVPPGAHPQLIEWNGDPDVPPWRGVRTSHFAYIENHDGTVELYDLTGRIGRADPQELRNVADRARYAATRKRLALTLDRLASRSGR
jgi:N-acetylglucosamine-6-sulfatase